MRIPYGLRTAHSEHLFGTEKEEIGKGGKPFSSFPCFPVPQFARWLI